MHIFLHLPKNRVIGVYEIDHDAETVPDPVDLDVFTRCRVRMGWRVGVFDLSPEGPVAVDCHGFSGRRDPIAGAGSVALHPADGGGAPIFLRQRGKHFDEVQP